MPEENSHEYDLATTKDLFLAHKANEQPHCPACNGPDPLIFKPNGPAFEVEGAKSWNVRCPNRPCPKRRNFRVLPDGQIVP